MPDEFVFIEPEFALAYADVCAVAVLLFLGLRGCGGVTSFHKVSLSPGVPIVVCCFSIFELAESKIFNSMTIYDAAHPYQIVSKLNNFEMYSSNRFI